MISYDIQLYIYIYEVGSKFMEDYRPFGGIVSLLEL